MDDKLTAVVPVGEKDAGLFLDNIHLLFEYLPIFRVLAVGSQVVREKLKSNSLIEFVDENDLYPGLSYSVVKKIIVNIDPKAVNRTGWYLQQFIKYAYALITEESEYLVWDSDTLPLKKIKFIEMDTSAERAYYFNLKSEFHPPYFDTLEKLLGEGR